MKWLFVLLLALAIFGGAAWFGYNTFVKEEIEVKKEQRGEVTPPPAVDVSLPDFEAAVKLREDGKLTETRDALVAFIQKYPNGKHLDEARDVLGDVNTAILLSRRPSPEKIEYIVKPGDVLAKIARKLQTTPEMIMRARQSCRRNNRLKSRRKLPKRWLGKVANALASAPRSIWPAQSGSGWPARQLTRCMQCRMQRTPISTNRHRRPVSVSPRLISRS